MHRVFLQIIRPILFVRKFHHKNMCHATLENLKSIEFQFDEEKTTLTVLPSGLFCFPPIPDLTYGVFDVGCKHWSLSANMRSHV
jgi:hypothetical protein